MNRLFDQVLDWTRQFFDLKSKEVDPIVQFARYGFCGVAATIAHNVVWYLLARTAFPALYGLEWNGEVLTEGNLIHDKVRSWNTFYSNAIAFVIGNFVAYFSNVAFVFKQGKHSIAREFLSFTLVALVAFTIASLAGPYLIGRFGISTALSQISFVITSMLVNFMARKFFIFAG